MRSLIIATLITLGLLFTAPAIADPVVKKADVKAAAKTPATKAPVKTDVKKADEKKAPAKTTPAVDPTAGDPTMPSQVPEKPGDAMIAAGKLLEMVKAKKWFGFSAGLIWLLMSLFKYGRRNLAFMQKIPKRALWVAVPILSVAAMVLAKLQGEMSWGAAATVLFSGPSVAFLNDFVKRGLLGEEPSPLNGGTGKTS